MGNVCSCCSKERSVEELLDGSLEDKLLGKREEEVEATTAEDEAWRQRRQEAEDEADMSFKSVDADNEDKVQEEMHEADLDHAALIWDLSDRNTVRAVHKEVEAAVEEEEDEEAFGSAKEEEEQDEEAQQLEGDAYRLTQLSSRSTEDSYASLHDYERGNSAKVFRDTQLEGMTDTFLASTSPSSLRDTTFMDDYDGKQEQQQQEVDEENEAERRRSSASSSSSQRRRSSKKKSRRKSQRK